MKNITKIWIYSLTIVGVLIFLTYSCKKEENNDNTDTGSVTDIDGNVYHTVVIGTQVWMVENLKTTRFTDGTNISVPDATKSEGDWHTPKYCWYENDVANKNKFGALYNFWTIRNTQIVQHQLAPTGWHIPTYDEWNILINYLGGENIAGGKLKEAGIGGVSTGLWYSPNSGATNESGFSALPGGLGLVYDSLSFSSAHLQGFWWSASYEDVFPWSIWLDHDNAFVTRTSQWSGNCFLSVRCIKDQTK